MHDATAQVAPGSGFVAPTNWCQILSQFHHTNPVTVSAARDARIALNKQSRPHERGRRGQRMQSLPLLIKKVKWGPLAARYARAGRVAHVAGKRGRCRHHPLKVTIVAINSKGLARASGCWLHAGGSCLMCEAVSGRS